MGFPLDPAIFYTIPGKGRPPARQRHEAERIERLATEHRRMLRANNFGLAVFVAIILLLAWMVLT